MLNKLIIGNKNHIYYNGFLMINSCFGLAFDDAAERTKSRVNFCFLDNSSETEFVVALFKQLII